MESTHLIMEGTLDQLHLTDILQTIGNLRRPVAVLLNSVRGSGLVCIQDGHVMWAQSGTGTIGMEAFASLLNTAWEHFAVYRFEHRLPPQCDLGMLVPLLLRVQGPSRSSTAPPPPPSRA